MRTKVDEEKLIDILRKYHLITQLKMTIFDDEHNVLAEYPKTHCAFCNYINSTHGGKLKCEESNWEAFKACKEDRKIHIYRCHMGLLEVAFPLIKNEQILGYAMFGQIKNQKNDEFIQEKLLEFDSGLTSEKVEEILTSITYHSSERIKAEVKILDIVATYFIDNQMIEFKADLMNKILYYIDNTPLKDFKIDNLCQHLGISRTLVYSTFSKNKNIGIIEYVRDIKIKKAKELLETQKYSIKEIAYITGFSDSNHFIKVFKKYVNLTPKQYQQKN